MSPSPLGVPVMATVRMTLSEREELKKHAKKNGLSLNDYCRYKLGLQIRNPDIGPDDESISE